VTGLRIGIMAPGLDRDAVEAVRQAERLGVESVWAPEAWMYDALTPLAAYAAVTEQIRLAAGVVQVGARSPAMLAMSALALQKLSDGRFVLGLGTSGPQVMEGWHGVPFERPIARTAETIDIVRSVVAGERLRHDGKVYTLPLPDDVGTGQGRALRSPVADPDRPIPIHVASMGPANLRLTGAKADGWVGTAFLPESADAFLDPLREGAATADRSLDELELSVAASLVFTDDPEQAGRRHAGGYAFTIGAMGSTATNFYNRAFARQGFGDEVETVARLWRDGDREAAAEAVPIELGLHTNLIGDDRAVTERLRRYRDAGITTLRVNVDLDGEPDPAHHRTLDHLARLLDCVASLDASG
jgi:F420-dependent oxidoreductase-like protein